MEPKPLPKPLSPLEIFVCTYNARVTSLNIPHRRLIEIVKPHGAVKTINCNFGHKTQEGFEMYLKKEKKNFDTTRGGTALRNRHQRKREGDGSCFNSAIEPVIIPKSSMDRTFAGVDIHFEKAYYLRYFPTCGEIQVPGVIQPDLKDGHRVVSLWVDFLNNTDEITEPISIHSEGPLLINFKFHVMHQTPRTFLNLETITEFLKTATDAPYTVREVITHVDPLKISANCVVPNSNNKGKVRIIIYLRGKINILGSPSFTAAEHIYTYISTSIHDNWNRFVILNTT